MPEYPPFDDRNDWSNQPISPLPFNNETFDSTNLDDIIPIHPINDNHHQHVDGYSLLQRQSSIDSISAFMPFPPQNDHLIAINQPSNQLISPHESYYPNQQHDHQLIQNHQYHGMHQHIDQHVQNHQYHNHMYQHNHNGQYVYQNNQSMYQSGSPSSTTNSDPSSPSINTYSSNSSMAASSHNAEHGSQAVATEQLVVAVAVHEDSEVVKKARHREIDRKRREREQRVLARLASLVNAETDSNLGRAASGNRRAVVSRGKSKAKPLDRVALLEAACDRLEANRRELETHYLIQNSRMKDMSVKLVCLAADTGHKVDTDSVYESVPRLTGTQSMHWMLIQAELEAAHARNESDPLLALTLPASSMYTSDFRPSNTDPQFTDLMKNLYSLFRGDSASVQISFKKPDSDNHWTEATVMVYLAPKPRFYGRADSDRSLTKGRVIVMAWTGTMPTPPAIQPHLQPPAC